MSDKDLAWAVLNNPAEGVWAACRLAMRRRGSFDELVAEVCPTRVVPPVVFDRLCDGYQLAERAKHDREIRRFAQSQ